MRRCASSVAAVTLLCAIAAPALTGRFRVLSAPAPGDTITISIVGTTDLHGVAFARNGRGGLALLAGFVNNLRAAREADGGAVLLLDAGDTFLGGIESNLSEGALIVDAYNEMGYTAAAIGNHEFDFGPADAAGARQKLSSGDARGAVKARAAQAHYPFLAANLIDAATGKPVDWPNVRPSMMVKAAGVRVGIVGVMTIDALRATLPVNVQGLRVAPLAPAIAAEAEKLRAEGAEVIVALAHAGGYCWQFGSPADLTSCDSSSEIFALARDLPAGLVDVIAAGHTHDAVAHVVAGVAIVQAYSQGRAFARADLVVDRASHRVVRTDVFPPREVCAQQDPLTLNCDGSASMLPVSHYEGRPVTADAAVTHAMAPALARVRALQAAPMGVQIDRPLGRTGDLESPLGNLFADALRERLAADVALVNSNARGGLRADFPEGALTFGHLYDVFPFDNRVVRLTLTGDEVTRVFAEEIRRRRRGGTLGTSGVIARVSCSSDGPHVDLLHADGQPVDGSERLNVVTMDTLATGLVFTTVPPPAGFTVPQDAPVLREVVEDWLRHRGGHLAPEQFVSADHPRWTQQASSQAGCVGQ